MLYVAEILALKQLNQTYWMLWYTPMLCALITSNSLVSRFFIFYLFIIV